MRRTISLLGALVVVLFAVGCGPPDAEEIAQQDGSLKATPILMGAGCPAAATCNADYANCSEWSAPITCSPDTCSVAQYQTCYDSKGNECVNISLSRSTADGCN